MRHLLIAIALGSLIALSSCEKEKEAETKVHGQILEKGSGKPIAGATVQLIENDYYTYNIDETIVQETVTRADGRYAFEFEADRDEDFKVAADAPLYYTNNPDGNLGRTVDNGKTQTQNVELVPYAWLKIKFINESGADFINMNPLEGELRIAGATSGYQINVAEATIVAQAMGNEENEIDYFVYPGGQHTEVHFFASAHDTAYYEITY